MGDLSETVARPDYSVLTVSETSSGTITLQGDFPQGIWELLAISVQLGGVDSLDQGLIQVQTSGGQTIEVLPLLSVGWLNSTNSYSRFDGTNFILAEGDYIRYRNTDVTASGSGTVTMVVKARRLR